MDFENNLPLEPLDQEENGPAETFEPNENEIILPDDALSHDGEDNTVLNEEKEDELLPQSLFDEDDGDLDEEEEIFLETEPAASYFSKSEGKVLSSQGEEASLPEEADALPSPVKKEKTGFANSFFDIVEMFVFALAFVLIAMAFFGRHSVVDGSSMENTLYEGEHLIISDFLYTPKPGDIVVVQDASKADVDPTLAKPIVKRVIAVAGQTVSIRYNGEVYVDGTLLDEDYVYIDYPDYVYEEISITVDEGCVFLMGDHRNVSLDSRSEAGCFREQAILGKVILRFLPFDRFGTIE